MRILYHHRTRAEDAQGVHITALCDAFRQLGHEVEMVALVAANEKKREVKKLAVRKTGNSLFNFEIPHWLYELFAVFYNVPAFIFLTLSVLRFRPDFIYERYSLFTVSGLLVARLFKLPFILEVNAPLSLEMQSYESLSFQRLAQHMEDWLSLYATRTIVVSSPMKTIFQQRGLPAEKFMVLPNGVDPETFHPHVDGNEVRKTQRLAGKFVVGFVGWIRPWHGIDILLDTIALLEKRIPDLHLLLVGDGPAVPELQAQTQRLGLMEKVHFTGPVPKQKIPSYIAAMDIAVQPDVTDYASPIKLFEYLAMGKAVIAPRKDNIVEIVEHEKHALLYKARDTKELADRIEQLYIDRELRKRLGLAAYQLVQEKGLYWRANASRVVEVIEKARKGQSFV